jgi:hypothetical protein
MYVNERLVGSYVAHSYDHLPSSGEAGVYLDETAMTGVFTQFSVYPAPDLSLWDHLPAIPR